MPTEISLVSGILVVTLGLALRIGRQYGLEGLPTCDAKYLEVGISSKSDNVDAIFEKLRKAWYIAAGEWNGFWDFCTCWRTWKARKLISVISFYILLRYFIDFFDSFCKNKKGWRTACRLFVKIMLQERRD